MPIDPKNFPTRAALEAISLRYDPGEFPRLPSPPLTRWQRVRHLVKVAWFDARWWFAEKVLRLPMGER